MGLSLLVGPANAGKVALLVDRYVAALDRDPVLIVPNRSDVARVERDVLARQPLLLGGFVGTFDDVFARVASRPEERARPVATEVQRTLVLRRAIAGSGLNGLGASARSSGFVEALRDAVEELQSNLLEPSDVGGDLARLYRAYRDELERLGLTDPELVRARAVDRLTSDLDAWHGQPVFAYGFEDLTQAEWRLLEALAGRAEVVVSLPYEPGRAAFASLRRTVDDLAALAGPRVEELPPAWNEVAHPAIAHVERALFDDGPADGEARDAPPIEGAVRFFEGAGPRGALELVAEEVLDLVRGGQPPASIGVVVPSLERWRAPLETAFATLGVPYGFGSFARLPQTPFGHALLSLLGYAWRDRGRAELFAYLRSPYSHLARHHVDFLEGRLRGRAIAEPVRVEQEVEALRGARLPTLDALRAADAPVAAVRELAASMLSAAHGLDAPPVGIRSQQDLHAYEAATRALDELDAWERAAGAVSREDVVAALERAPVRGPRADEDGRVAVVDLNGARTRRFEVVFVLGLEEGTLPRRGAVTPLLDDDARRRLGGRLVRVDQVSRDRYLFYTACTRAARRLYLVREAATDEGSPREPSPFWDELAGLFPADDVSRWTRRRPLSALTWPLETAPTERERLRALASLAAADETRETAEALARANGWERRLRRAVVAFERPTRLRHPLVLEQLRSRFTFNVTELERFADCSSAWFVDRFVDPKTIDAEVDAKLRGSVAHNALFKFFSGLPRRLGSDRVDAASVEDAVRFMRTCLDQAMDGVRMELTPMQRRELHHGLWRDLEQVVREEAEAEHPLVPSRFEVSFGSERSARELQRGLDLGEGIALSGKIDRIDVDPFSARGIVQDYKAGKHAHSAREIASELRLQIPLYMLVLRDLVGIEPLGGVYRPLAGDRRARGLLRAEAREDVLPGYAKTDYLDDDAFWSQVDEAKAKAGELASRIRAGDVSHDPKGGDCPSWCDLWPMCRVRRA